MNYKFYQPLLSYPYSSFKFSRSYRYTNIPKRTLSTRKKIYLRDLIYKDIPAIMCKCSDCRMARKIKIKGYNAGQPNNRNFINRAYDTQYKTITQITQELRRGVIFVDFNYGGFTEKCTVEDDILKLIRENNIPFSFAIHNGYTVRYIELPYYYGESNLPELELLDRTIEDINKEDRYKEYRDGYCIVTLNADTGESFAPADYKNNAVNLFYVEYEPCL